MSKLLYVTSNAGKFAEASLILGADAIERVDFELPELQGEPEEIVAAKVAIAFEKFKAPLLVEDVSLHCDALNGFPGPYIKDMLKKIGEKGVFEVAQAMGNPRAQVVCTVGYLSAELNSPLIASGALQGTLVAPKGTSRFGKYSWNPIFVPEGHSKTFGEFSLEEQSQISMRRVALDKMRALLKT